MDRVIEELLKLLRDRLEGTRGIKSFYNGKPMKIPNDSFPAIVVKGTSMRSEILDTHRNQEVFNLQVTLMQDQRNLINSDDNEDTTERAVRRIFEEREDGSNELCDNTILAVILKEFMYLENFNLHVTVDQVKFDKDLDDFFDTDFPGFYGRADITVVAKPHRVREP